VCRRGWGSGFQGKVSLFLGLLHLLLCMKAPAYDEADNDWFIRIPGAARVEWRMKITIAREAIFLTYSRLPRVQLAAVPASSRPRG
jgi:hypothetical protein